MRGSGPGWWLAALLFVAALLGVAGCEGGGGSGGDGAVVDGAVDGGAARDRGSAEMGAGEMGAGEMGAGEMGAGEMGIDDMGVDDSGVEVDRGLVGDMAVGPDAGPAPVQPDPAVFDGARLFEVEVEMDPADWDALRAQNRGELDLMGPDCLDEPFASPYDWFPARVTVDGAVYDRVGIRKKGFFGSVSSSRPSVRIAFDEYVEGQSHRGLTRMALNNGRQDASRLRTCLAYGVFARMGAPTPRCNFARVTVNGQPLGVYAHVESIGRPFLAAQFGDPDGWLYEGTLSDFRPEWRGTMEQKTREEAPHTGGIDRVIAALGAADDELIAALQGALDLDAFLTFWAAETLVAHWDGYAGNTNNFWFYEHPRDGLIRFIPWGPDAAFQSPRLFFEGLVAPHSVFAVGAVARRLYLHPEGRARYLARLEALVEVYEWAGLDGEIDRMQALIAPGLLPGSGRGRRRRWRSCGGGWRGRRRRCGGAGGGARWELPLRDTLCTEPGWCGAFATVWGRPTADVPAAGMGASRGSIWRRRRWRWRWARRAGVGDQGGGAGGESVFWGMANDHVRLSGGGSGA
ncbi:MAG: CotH kinase family protein [bacterium]